MLLPMRPLNVRLAVAYMATAAHSADTDLETLVNCPTGNSWSRLRTEFENGYNGVGHDHPYMELWIAITAFYHAQGWDKLCDAEILQLQTAAMGVGFTTKSGTKVVPQFVHKSVKQWANNGWFRYEHQRSSRRKIAGRVGFIALALVGVPMVGDV